MVEREAGILLLEDGRVFRGEHVGAPGVAVGEVVFNTSMSGYQEVLTDPSYAGQIVTMTYPLIGNYGVTAEDEESARPRVAGFVMRELSPTYTGWRGTESLLAYLERSGVAALTEVDTRALTRHIRSAGAMLGAIAPASTDRDELRDRLAAHPRMEGLDLTGEVSTLEPYDIPAVGDERFFVIAYDFGIKGHSPKLLAERGCRVRTVPRGATPGDVLESGLDGLFISNGPGDPDAVAHALETIRGAADRGIPVFGICLGHQLVARAFGGHTYKLKYGHRGGNHPVKRLGDGAVEITAQNHGFAVRAGEGEDAVEGAPDLRVTHLNLNDGTVEGLEHRTRPVFSVQYHPEAAPGPHDSRYLFDRFVSEMAQVRGEP
ncbi:MAG TPA: glutamine-hydrolyzing carbamoyl-phosphate synthase small subunit [Longimicrobiales bacterium]|nr:glutamine-hydrolyzing carbamoyl-phosphate synthase small subunit [Longimicrobiales bacterium]